MVYNEKTGMFAIKFNHIEKWKIRKSLPIKEWQNQP
jgi:hypothetical protein